MRSLAERILAQLRRPKSNPLPPAALARAIGLSRAELSEFKQTLRRLVEQGMIVRDAQGAYRAGAAPGQLQGTFKRLARGGGIVLAGEAGKTIEFAVPEGSARDAHTGDVVLLQPLARRGRMGKPQARVVGIVERATTVFVGVYFEQSGRGYVQVEGNAFADPVYVGDARAKGAVAKELVVIEMVRFPSAGSPGEAVIVEVLGPRGKPGVDTQTVIRQFNLPDEFSQAVLDEAREQARRFDETDLRGRRDLTRETIVTIDPVDARDFDDAISLTVLDNGHWRLGVHIADVSHFVRPGTALDDEARERGNSVYLPDRVLPMLPEVISNGLASLQQGKLRYTKSVFLEFTAEGAPVGAEFVSSAICATRRFAYEEVSDYFADPPRWQTRLSAEVRTLLDNMRALARLLRRRRFAAGAIELTLPEVKIDMDGQGAVTGAHLVPHDESHQIIEEFMLAANVAVATALAQRGVPFMRRVHGDPDPLRLQAFSEFAASLGFVLKKWQSRRDLQALLEQAAAHPARQAINYAFLRSMKQAEYAVDAAGHYALAAADYCHFTSPIRRYPDLTVHRLFPLLEGGRKPKLKAAGLPAAAKHCSFTERRAERAERELIKLKLLQYLSTRVGWELDAVITGVTDFGFFCQGIELPAEGLVRIASLGDDWYDFDERLHRLVARRSGRQFRLGDTVRVAVAHVDAGRRELEFRVVRGGTARRSAPPSPRADDESPPRGRPSEPAAPRRAKPGRNQRRRKK